MCEYGFRTSGAVDKKVTIMAISNDNIDSYHTDSSMNTSILPKSKSSYNRSFDDMVERNQLLFRLHSHNLSETFLPYGKGSGRILL